MKNHKIFEQMVENVMLEYPEIHFEIVECAEEKYPSWQYSKLLDLYTIFIEKELSTEDKLEAFVTGFMWCIIDSRYTNEEYIQLMERDECELLFDGVDGMDDLIKELEIEINEAMCIPPASWLWSKQYYGFGEELNG